MFNHTYRYALRACAMIASMPPSTRILAKDLAKESDIPAQYLSKILHKLVRSGVLSSRKGIGGGFFLERDPAEVKLLEVVRPFRKRKDAVDTSCLVCGDRCLGAGACPFKRYWEEAVGRYRDLLENTTLADVACPLPHGAEEDAAPRGMPAAEFEEHSAAASAGLSAAQV